MFIRTAEPAFQLAVVPSVSKAGTRSIFRTVLPLRSGDVPSTVNKVYIN